jgi:membrane protein
MGDREGLTDRPFVATALRVQERYKQDAGEQLAAAIAYFGFLSFVPLLLLAVAVVGFVLDDPDRQLEVALLLTEALPGFEGAAAEPDSAINDLLQTVVDARGAIGLIGLVTLLFSGLKVIASAMTTTRVVFRGAVLKGVGARVRQLLALVGLGVLALAAAGGSSLAAQGVLAAVPRPLAILLSFGVTFALDLALFLGAYWLLSPSSQLSLRQLLPGALLGAAGWAILKVVGTTYVGNQVDTANALYGALGSVFALLVLLYLAGRLYVYGAELSAVLVERRHGPLRVPEEEAPPAPEVGDRGPDATGRRAPDQAPAPAVLAARPSGRPRTTPTGPTRTTAPARTPPPAGTPRLHPEDVGTVRDPGSDLRRTVALGLSVAALAAGWRLLGRDEQ